MGGQGNMLESTNRIDLTSSHVREDLRARVLQHAFPAGPPTPAAAGAGPAAQGEGGGGNRRDSVSADKGGAVARSRKLDSGGGDADGDAMAAAGGTQVCSADVSRPLLQYESYE